MRLITLPFIALFACAGSSSSSQDPSTPATYPPEMAKGDNVDENGRALDPKIASCIDVKLAMDAKIGGAAIGLGTAILGENDAKTSDLSKTPEADFSYCWCKSRGFRGQRRDGSCLE